MKIKLQKPVGYDDWYQIVRVEHDGREWLEPVGDRAFHFMMSERLSPEACIEGSAEEMQSIAKAIEEKGEVHFKRCAVRYVAGEGFAFCSPKNSRGEVIIPVEDAEDFAKLVRAELP